ncbi:N-terminal glutamine amidase-domain-containing protein [Paraphysoderma sedebokerense]|nr:N-terminal glutamine amidase-domain-containing protein [Paraphysoderma sedebokerense]
MLPPILRSKCVYTSCYCEENVYFLIKSLPDELKEHAYAVFVSNENQTVPMWCQQAAKEKDDPVIWDYHVILLLQVPPNSVPRSLNYIYDCDTTLGFPCSFKEYVARTFMPGLKLDQRFTRKFRLVQAKMYEKWFSSDRSHMIKSSCFCDSSPHNCEPAWNAPPPPYPPIHNGPTKMNLQTYTNMTEKLNDEVFGKVLTEEEFYNLF